MRANRSSKAKQKPREFFHPGHVAAKLRDRFYEDLLHYGKTVIDPPSFCFFEAAQKAGLLKKFKDDRVHNDTRGAALSRFCRVQQHLASIVVPVIPDPLEIRKMTTIPASILRLARARSVCHQILGDLDLEEIFLQAKHGPNSSIGVSFFDSGNSAKWKVPLSITPNCVGLFRQYIAWDTSFQEMLVRANPDFQWGNALFDVVEGARGTTVPKDDLIDRFIAVEPTANMFLQQGAASVLASRLKAFGVDLAFQQVAHRYLALESSITATFGTIDFSSASDCVKVELVKELLPPSWFELLMSLRSPSVGINGERVIPSCISSMGNATTFPVETLIFFALAVASVSSLRTRSLFPEWEDFKSVSVFGDDCILPTEFCEIFVELSESVGFITNREKTFIDKDGKFRESCGADYFRSRNVRPYYVRAPSSNKRSVLRAWLYTLWNGVLRRQISAFGPLTYVYSSSLRYLASLISQYNKEIYVVPREYPDDAGIKTGGDWVRLQRLFAAKPGTILRDIHGTSKFHALKRVKPDCGTIIPEWEYWFALKFSAMDHTHLSYVSSRPGSSRPFEELLEKPFQANRERVTGYVVSVGTVCTNFQP